MPTFDAIALTVQAILLVAIGLRLRGRLHAGDDFILGRRRLSAPLSVAALAMNSIPFWWLLVLVGAAFTLGLAAVWIALALLGGVFIGGWYVAPRLRALTNVQQRGTFSELIVGDAGENMRAIVMRSTLLIVIATLLFSCAVQLQLAAHFLEDTFSIVPITAIILIVGVLCLSTMLAGFWTTVITDAWQIIVWTIVCVVTLIAVAIAVSHSPMGATTIFRGDWFAGNTGVLTISFTLGIAFIGGDIAGQAPVLARYMACASDVELARARLYALLWGAIALLLSLSVGWGLRALSDAPTIGITAIVTSLSRSLSPNVISILSLLLLGAATIGIGNGFQTMASHLANDLRRGGTSSSLVYCRLALVLIVSLSAALAIYLPYSSAQNNFDRLLFCWHALGAAFGPLLIVRLSGKRVRPGSTLGSIWSGFLLTLVFYLMPDSPGELLERGLPFTAALGIALSGGERRRNPDRADRGDRTVHDRLPI